MLVRPLENPGTVLSNAEARNIKAGFVVLHKGEEVGEHVTESREEAIVILKGTATVVCEGEERRVPEKNLVYIPEGKKHNVKNESDDALEYVYIVSRL